MEASTIFKSATLGLGGAIGWFLGGWDMLLRFMVILAVVDFITGSVAASIKGEAKSKVGFIGIARKVMIFTLIGIATHLDNVFGQTSAIREAVLFFYIANELLSIVENAGKIGVPMPPAIINSVAILKGKAEVKKEGKNGQ
ncbi:holin [Bacillus phage Wes44]|uniref:Holin n=1 Tax=Bacillus phage Wes44 TaxID=2283012 RepID=A0A346FK42_9CAUD|nr:holin [Bacillus phage Wes44]AXN58347.1 holin [Bacillus phage Wes44]